MRCDVSFPVLELPLRPCHKRCRSVLSHTRVVLMRLAGCLLVSVLSLAWWKRAGRSLTSLLHIVCIVFCVRAGLVAGERPSGPLLWQTAHNGTCGPVRDLTQAGVGANPRQTGGVGVEKQVRALKASTDRV